MANQRGMRNPTGGRRAGDRRRDGPGGFDVDRRAARNGTLLLVDSDRSYNDRVAEYLRQQGIAVVQRFDGWSAVHAIAETNPALVLMAIELPDINAIAVTQRALALGTDPQIILMSDKDEWLKIAECSRLHFLRVLGKPLPLRILGNFLSQCLAPGGPRAA